MADGLPSRLRQALLVVTAEPAHEAHTRAAREAAEAERRRAAAQEMWRQQAAEAERRQRAEVEAKHRAALRQGIKSLLVGIGYLIFPGGLIATFGGLVAEVASGDRSGDTFLKITALVWALEALVMIFFWLLSVRDRPE